MQKTTNYNLNKPDAEDFYNVEDFNQNMDKIDTEIKNANNKLDNMSAEQVNAVPKIIERSNNIFKLIMGDHTIINNAYDASVPVMPAVSNFLHLVTFDGDDYKTVVNVLSIPSDFSKDIYTYNRNKGEWVKIADESEYLPLIGGVLSGSLSFSNFNNFYAIQKGRTLPDGTTHWLTMGIGSDGATSLEHYTGDSTDYTKAVQDARLELRSLKTHLTDALDLRDNANGILYKIYGQHNKLNLFNDLVANNLATTEAGKFLDARQGKVIGDKLAVKDVTYTPSDDCGKLYTEVFEINGVVMFSLCINTSVSVPSGDYKIMGTLSRPPASIRYFPCTCVVDDDTTMAGVIRIYTSGIVQFAPDVPLTDGFVIYCTGQYRTT